MPPHSRKFFEELGLAEEMPPEVNPLQTLGVDTGFAHELLKEDPTGASVHIVVQGMHRALSRIYHTDMAASDVRSAEKFKSITEARERVAGASRRDLSRWAQPVRPAMRSPRSSAQTHKSDIRADRASELVRMNMELGSDPLHFSQFRWSQGALLHHRQKGALLLQNDPLAGTKQLLPGEKIDTETLGQGAIHRGMVEYFQRFMRTHGWFGIEPDTRIALYVDEHARASVLDPGMSFLMDITHPLRNFQEQRPGSDEEHGWNDTWARGTDPTIITSRVSDDPKADPLETSIIVFSIKKGHSSMAQQMPFEMAGSLVDQDFFRSIRHKQVGAVALSGAGALPSYFGMSPTTVTEMIDKEAGYSPLVVPGNALVLYDARTQKPQATDLRILGMLGNGAQHP